MLAAIACSNVLITQIFLEPPTTISHGLACRKQGEDRGGRAFAFATTRRRSIVPAGGDPRSRPPGVGLSGNVCFCGDAGQIDGDAGP